MREIKIERRARFIKRILATLNELYELDPLEGEIDPFFNEPSFIAGWRCAMKTAITKIANELNPPEPNNPKENKDLPSSTA